MYPPLLLSRRTIVITGIGIALLVIALIWQLSKVADETHGLWMFDVPGEAIFVALPSGHHILVDAGETAHTVIKINELLPFWSREIDVLILTHADRDHIGGALAVLQQYRVHAILLPGSAEDSLLFEAIVTTANKQNIPLLYATGAGDMRLGDTILDVVYPQRSTLAKITSERNSTSLMLRLIHGGTSTLLTGDSEQAEETEVLRLPVRVRSNHLKVPHHGSKTSSSAAFLRATAPKIAFVSAHKDNPYGHPHTEVVDRYAKNQIPLFNTGKIGDIHVRIFDPSSHLFSL